MKKRNDSMKKQILSFILTICLVLTMMPAMSITASAEAATQVHVGGTDVVSGTDVTYWLNDDSGGITNDGANESNYNVKYDPNIGGTSILTLKDVNIASGSAINTPFPAHFIAAVWADGDIDVVVEGTNTITGPENNSGDCYGIYVFGNLNMSGSGSLTAVGGDITNLNTTYISMGIFADQAATVSGISVTGKGGDTLHPYSEAGSIGIHANLTVVGGGTVTAVGGSAGNSSYGLLSTSYCTVNSGTLTAESGPAKYSFGIRVDKPGNFTITNGTVNATGGTGNPYSYGVQLNDSSSINISGGTLNVTGGTAVQYQSSGISGYNNSGDINVSGGEVTAAASSTTSHGISVKNINFTGGTLTAKATGVEARAISTTTAFRGDVNVQIKAGNDESDADNIIADDLTIGDYKYLRFEPGPEATPTADIDYVDEKLTGLSPNEVYIVDGYDRLANGDGTIAIDNDWFGNTISLVKKGSTPSLNSSAQSITLAARPAAPACTVTQPSAGSVTGTITGITAAMEYSTDSGISWTPGTGSDVAGLAPGAVLIRVKATVSAPSSQVQTITITAYSAPSGGGSSGGSGGSNSKGSTAAPATEIKSGESIEGTNLDKLVKAGKSLTIEGKAGERVLFDTEALKNINSQTKDSVKVEIRDVSSDYKNEHPHRLVVSLTVTAGGKRISDFGKGSATVSLPYELKEGEKAEDVTVWYLAEDGTMTEVPCIYDPVTKLATFKVNHFSLYVVGTANTSKWINPYSDVKESSWYYDAVRYVSANGLMQGTEAAAFSPNAKTSRGMIVTILWRMENEPEASKEIAFADVKTGKYYYDAVAWASEKGIVGGYSNERFGPEDNITREQLAVILYNYAASKGYDTGRAADLSSFGDAGSIHSWAKDAMSWATAEGLISGKGNNLLDPLGAAERCQVAAILQRFMENTVK